MWVEPFGWTEGFCYVTQKWIKSNHYERNSLTFIFIVFKALCPLLNILEATFIILFIYLVYLFNHFIMFYFSLILT